MDTKLTLKLDTAIIELAKSYAKDKNTSLSKLIENYLQAVTKNKKQPLFLTAVFFYFLVNFL